MSRAFRSVMDDMEYSGKSYEEVMEDRMAAADAEHDRRKDDALTDAYERLNQQKDTHGLYVSVTHSGVSRQG